MNVGQPKEVKPELRIKLSLHVKGLGQTRACVRSPCPATGWMWASERTASQVGLELESKVRVMLKVRLKVKVEAEPAGALDEQMSLLADC